MHPAKLFAGQKLKKALMFALFEHVIAGSKDFLLIATTAPLFTEAASGQHHRLDNLGWQGRGEAFAACF